MLLQGTRSRVAVIVNRRARGARPEVVEHLERLVHPRDLFVSRDADHSRAIARTIVERRYDGVLFGGGDGTFVQCISDIAAEAESWGTPLPGVGVLRLGTGNALAETLGASNPTLTGLAADLRRARTVDRPKTLPLLRTEGKLTPFAGCGLDAMILDDFHKLGAMLDRVAGPLAARIGANERYAMTVGLRSVPRFVLTRRPTVELVTTGDVAYRIDWRTGRVVDEEPLPPGTVLFRGPATLATATTIPYFGLRMKMFPFAQVRDGFFNVRCATSSAFEALSRLPWVWTGEYRSPTLQDFLVKSCELRMDRPTPVQIGGDLQPDPRRSLEISLHHTPVRVFA
jgi:diacylglycerol kinase family enzyme